MPSAKPNVLHLRPARRESLDTHSVILSPAKISVSPSCAFALTRALDARLDRLVAEHVRHPRSHRRCRASGPRARSSRRRPTRRRARRSVRRACARPRRSGRRSRSVHRTSAYRAALGGPPASSYSIGRLGIVELQGEGASARNGLLRANRQVLPETALAIGGGVCWRWPAPAARWRPPSPSQRARPSPRDWPRRLPSEVTAAAR